MENETNPNIFEIRINETGKKYIHKFYRLGTSIFVINIILNLVFLVTEIYNLVEILSQPDADENLYLIIFPVFYIIYTVFAFLGVYYYVIFSRKINAGIVNYNEFGLNLSFRYLYLNALIFLISMIFLVLASFLNVFSVIYR